MHRKLSHMRPRLEVFWENPPGPGAGLKVRLVHGGHFYERHVGANGYLTVVEAARVLRRHRAVVYRWAIAGRIKTRRVRGRIVVPVAEVKRLALAP